ncbi:uncharacterized protein IAS62_000132 [Cryptococcus decagattii]|uniref:Uncharacterized protein n=1 Tax=Cryptococcus decagattii TaxID=1859122 RepID=A0ABZ2AJZ0_9TREE
MVPKITSTSSIKTKNTKRFGCRARSNIPLTPTSLASPPLPANIRLSPLHTSVDCQTHGGYSNTSPQNCLSCYAPSYSRWPRDNTSLVNGQ